MYNFFIIHSNRRKDRRRERRKERCKKRRRKGNERVSISSYKGEKNQM